MPQKQKKVLVIDVNVPNHTSKRELEKVISLLSKEVQVDVAPAGSGISEFRGKYNAVILTPYLASAHFGISADDRGLEIYRRPHPKK